MLLIGHFCQILRVVQAGSQSEIIAAYFKFIQFHPLFKTLYLYEKARLITVHRAGMADEAVLQFPLFFLKVGQRKATAHTSETDSASKNYLYRVRR